MSQGNLLQFVRGYCDQCLCDPHRGEPCPERGRGPTSTEQSRAERVFQRGQRRMDNGRPMPPLDPGDTSDMWRDGE